MMPLAETIAPHVPDLQLPVEHDLLMTRAIEYGQRGELARAEELFRRILKAYPRSARTRHNLAVCLLQQGLPDQAEDLFQEAIQLDPGYACAHQSLGNLFQKRGSYELAETHLRRAFDLDPTSAEMLNDLGVLLQKRRRFEESTVMLQQATRLKPDFADAHNNLGISLTSLGHLARAKRALEKALLLKPASASFHSNLGNVYKEAGRLQEAIACYDLAIRYDPDNASTRWNRSLALLQSGDFKRGWEEYEWRWKRPEMPVPSFSQPRWRGEPIAGKVVLLHAEQGLGDTLQFIRFGSLLRLSGAKTVFSCPQPLLRLLRGCREFDQVIAEGDQLPEFDFHVPLMSLPYLFHLKQETFAANYPYLRPNEEDIKKGQQYLNGISKPAEVRVGISWQGNPHHAWDHFRSIPLELWDIMDEWTQPLCLVSLQTGPGSDQLQSCNNIIDMSSRIHVPLNVDGSRSDLADLAAIIQQLDLVITVDTAIAHLAGAMGVKVWILVSAISDWRWMRGRRDSPWYPSARLFRQKKLQEWGPVFKTVNRELQRVSSTRHADSL